MTSNDPIDAAASVQRSLHGKYLYIPDLRPVYASWTRGINKHYGRLVSVVNDQLEKIVHDRKRLAKCRAMDFALFTSMVYPNAEWEQLSIMALFFLWMFLWDDEIDKRIESDESDCASNFDAASVYRARSVAFVNYFLTQSKDQASAETAPPAPTDVCATFGLVAPKIVASALGQVDIEAWKKSLWYFMMASGDEQRYRLDGKLPTVENYWKFRHGTGGVDCICDLHQFVATTHLPPDLAAAEEVRTMTLETSKQTIMSNDLLSLKKELVDVTSSNLVLIMIGEKGLSLQAAVEDIVRQLHESAHNFNEAAARLRMKAKSHNVDVQQALERFIDPFETFQSGCFHWFAASKRYGVEQFRREDGSFLIPLGEHVKTSAPKKPAAPNPNVRYEPPRLLSTLSRSVVFGVAAIILFSTLRVLRSH
ncbi:terpenoid synthase [Thozetella sp. PMI_491]|nr:terpenoid synthase [Thozetella sp. PMI_491]